MWKNKRVTPKAVEYYFLIKNWEDIYKLWKTRIDRFNGDIYFYPWFDCYLTLNDWDEQQRRRVNYLSFHKSWEFHYKVEEWINEHRLSKLTTIITETWKNFTYWWKTSSSDLVRTQISEIKYQNMFKIFVKDFTWLVKFKKKIDQVDVIFEDINVKSIEFSFSIVSWKLIIWYNKWTLPKWISMSEKQCFKVHNRALWHESWNWDKLLQYSISQLEVVDFSWNTLLRVFSDSIINSLMDN